MLKVNQLFNACGDPELAPPKVLPDHYKSFAVVILDISYVVAPIVPPGNVKHDVGTNPFDALIARIGYCVVIWLGVKADIISIGDDVFVVLWRGNDVPILEYPNP